jgi:two-component system chemotaxis sensor kinase CheA
MDVVRQNIERMKGRVEISSTPGAGTVVTLRIPLTLAIIDGMQVRVGASTFILPMVNVIETVAVGAKDITTLSTGHELVKLRNRLLPVVRLHEFYSIVPDNLRIDEGLLVIVEDGTERLALLIDALIGQRQTVVKPLTSYLTGARGLAGCTVLGNGEISLILDVPKLIRDMDRAA